MDNADPTDVPYGLCHCGCGQNTEMATCTRRRYGWVKGEPLKFCRHHHLRKWHRRGPWYIIDENGCWIWQAAQGKDGYGRKYDPAARRLRPAHHVFYEKHRGPIPNGLHLDHLCRVPACVNPDHLEPVTCAENIRRGKKTRLSTSTIEAIRAAPGTNAEIAEDFGVSRSHVSRIRAYKRRVHA